MMERATGRRVGRLLVVGVVASALGLAAPAPALAHNTLVASAPQDGASLAEGPDEVMLEFLLPLDPDNTDLTVTGPDGEPAGTGAPEVDGMIVTLPVDATAAGPYQVAFEVLAEDGHLIDDGYAFTVAGAGEPASPSPAATASPTTAPATSAPESAVPISGTGSDEDSGSGLPWWVWLLIAAVLAGGAGYVAYRFVGRTSSG